jgi:hypothetical protein
MSNYFDNKDLFVGPKTNQYGGHMVMTNVVKERKKKYINVDTRFRDEYSSGGSCNGLEGITITLPERITEVKKIEVKCAEIPMSIFNISSDLGNNVLQVGGAVKTVQDGFYSAAQLKDAINTALSGTQCSVTIVNNKCLFTSTSASNIIINFAIDKSGSFDKYNLKSKLGWALGFRDISITIPAGGSVSGTGFIDLNEPRYLYLIVDEFNQGNPHSFIAPLPKSFINKNIIARIATNYQNFPYGSVLTANLTNGLLVSDKREFSGKVNLQKLNIQLVNEYGHGVDLNGLDFSFAIKVEHE